MKDGTLWFTVVTNKDRAFYRQLELGPFPSNFIFSSILGPFTRADEELGGSMEVLDLLKSNILQFTCVIFHFQDNGPYDPGFDDPPNAIDFCIIQFCRGLYSV